MEIIAGGQSIGLAMSLLKAVGGLTAASALCAAAMLLVRQLASASTEVVDTRDIWHGSTRIAGTVFIIGALLAYGADLARNLAMRSAMAGNNGTISSSLTPVNAEWVNALTQSQWSSTGGKISDASANNSQVTTYASGAAPSLAEEKAARAETARRQVSAFRSGPSSNAPVDMLGWFWNGLSYASGSTLDGEPEYTGTSLENKVGSSADQGKF